MAPRVVVIMGVAGSGKTTVGGLLARRLGVPFFDGDDFHPSENIEKMAQGLPLTDADREPWLETVRRLLMGLIEREEDAVVACSALKRRYRARLAVDAGVVLVQLEVPRAVLEARLTRRTDHFLPPGLLDSQLDDLEAPGPRVIVVDGSVDGPENVTALVEEALAPSGEAGTTPS